ncbi:hypothetical protein F5Y15DRAFT_272077 [Xylariaceae sp. FL0016]|nr:hypothetical protein F5Y15DRAFT_272077 [Xylariaceae sp. FL0016]
MASPPHPSHYAALEVDKTATEQEITTAYRRLARAHHPDKNPENVDEATAKFQKIQKAYEILSDPIKRARYDQLEHNVIFPFGDDEDDDDSYEFFYDDDNLSDVAWEDEEEFFQEFLAHVESAREGRGRREPGTSVYEQQFHNVQERLRQKRRDDLKQRRDAEEKRKQAKEAAKKAQADEAAEVERQQKSAEEKAQHVRWEKTGAAKHDEKLATCLHSSYCVKKDQRKKFKCAACKVKRGTLAFECPYCSQFLCQLCVTDFTKKRNDKSDDDQPSESATTAAQPHSEAAAGLGAVSGPESSAQAKPQQQQSQKPKK